MPNAIRDAISTTTVDMSIDSMPLLNFLPLLYMYMGSCTCAQFKVQSLLANIVEAGPDEFRAGAARAAGPRFVKRMR